MVKRVARQLMKRLRELELGRMRDPRGRRGRRWSWPSIIGVSLAGLMSGCKSLGELEKLTGRMSRDVQRMLGISGRLADTTLRDALCKASPDSCRVLLRRAVLKAKRRGAFAIRRGWFPKGVAALDGKGTALPNWASPYVQRHKPQDGAPYGLLRTITAVLSSHPARPCIDVSPIPATTNEMGHFETALGDLCDEHGDLFEIVTYDAGANSEHNAQVVLRYGKHYVFHMADDRREMTSLSDELLEDCPVVAHTTDVINNSLLVRRELRILRVHDHSQSPHKSLIWSHTSTILRVDSIATRLNDKGDVVGEKREARLYCSSLPRTDLSFDHWLALIRLHWRVELVHQTLDVAYQEDERPWIVANGNGALVMMVLRRIAYTIQALYRGVSLRSESNRDMPWAELLKWFEDAMKLAPPKAFEKLRPVAEPLAVA